MLDTLKVPAPFNQRTEVHSDDQVSRVLKYIYAYQNLDVIKDEINENNYYTLYAQAYALKCDKLLKELSTFNIECLLNETNVCHMYHDAIEHRDEALMRACADLLVQRFENIHEQGSDRQFLLELDVDNFVKILESD